MQSQNLKDHESKRLQGLKAVQRGSVEAAQQKRDNLLESRLAHTPRKIRTECTEHG
jgi:hypothetical protein